MCLPSGTASMLLGPWSLGPALGLTKSDIMVPVFLSA